MNRPRPERVLVGLVALDLLVTAVLHWQAWSTGWRLLGDNAIVVLRASDVPTSHTPLTGMPSGFSAWSDAADPYHPGPVGLWPLSPTAFFGSSEAVVLGLTWLVSAGCTVLVASIARRVAGPWVAIVATVSIVACQLAIQLSPLWVPVTPVLAAQPMFALCFLTWAIAAGHHRYWPLWLACATWVSHADLAFAPSVVALGLVALTTTGSQWRRVPLGERSLQLPRRTLAMGAVVLVVGWAGPALEAATNSGGNLRELLRAARADVPIAGPTRAIETLGSIVFRTQVTRDTLGRPVILACMVAATALVVLALEEARRTTPGRAALVPTIAAATTGAILGQALAPRQAGAETQYLLPVTVTTEFAWFGIVVLAGAAAERRWRANIEGTARLRQRGNLLVGAALGATLLLLVSGLGVRDPYLNTLFPSIDPVTAQVVRSIPPGRYRWVSLGGEDARAYAHGLALRLVDRGIEPRVDPPLAKYYGPHRLVDGRESGSILIALVAGDPPVSGATLIASWTAAGYPVARHRRTVATVASRVRARPIEFRPDANPRTVGIVLAAFGTRQRLEDVTEAAALDFGERLISNPSDVADLPDAVIAELIVRDQLAAPFLEPSDRASLDELAEDPVVRVWLVAGDAPG